jgi:hypothetical protein
LFEPLLSPLRVTSPAHLIIFNFIDKGKGKAQQAIYRSGQALRPVGPVGGWGF